MEPDRLSFYSKSADAAPGKGANEHVSDASAYKELASIPHWRRLLSNFHVAPFAFEGHTYRSIEHVFQAEKTALADPAKAYWFTVESGHTIGQGDGAEAQRNRKLVLLSKEQLSTWDLIKGGVMERAAIAKVQASEDARRVLKATGTAQLWHIVSRSKPIRFEHLERIRATL